MEDAAVKRARVLAAVVGALWLLSLSVAAPSGQAQPAFAALVERLSEAGGDFDTDNLISNERSYLQVAPALGRVAADGAYIGVGPDQNFSYIAQVRPRIAFIVDIRRDNLLLHLLFKAMFGLARSRVEYVAMLTGRTMPRDAEAWTDASVERIAAYVDGAPVDKRAVSAARPRIHEQVRDTGVPLGDADFATIDRFHQSFVQAGLSLKFQTFGRAPRARYPTYRELLLDRGPDGRAGSFLATEAGFRTVQSLENHDLVVPVVGDLAGPHALAEIGRLLTERHVRVSVLYVSNVEQYLFRDGRFNRYAENVRALPRDARGMVVRAIFSPWASGFRATDASVSVAQPLEEFAAGIAAGRYRSYPDLIAFSPR